MNFLTRITAGAAIATTLMACSAEQRADMESGKLDKFDLSADQREIAEALVEGYKKEMNLSLLRSQDYARAACYAKMVNMPSHLSGLHLIYLENYSEADKDWDGFFASRGMSAIAAYDMGEKFSTAYDKCSL